MKKSLILALSTAIALGAVAEPLLPPVYYSFEEGLGDFTAYDANNDGIKFKYCGTFKGLSNSNCVYYEGDENAAANDWLFSAPISMEQGKAYELTYYYKAPAEGSVNNIEWLLGSAASPEEMTIALSPLHQIAATDDFVKDKIRITAPAAGEYVLGLHLISDANQGNFYLDDLRIAKGVAANSPESPEASAPSFSVSGNNLAASFSITLPAYTSGGSLLPESGLSLKVKRNDGAETVTLPAVAGTEIVYTDNNASLFNVVYTFSCVANGEESPATEVVSAPSPGVPQKISGFRAVQNRNKFTLSWDAVTEPVNSGALFIPGKVKYTVKNGNVTLADHISETSVNVSIDMPESGQTTVSFNIIATLGNSQSETFKSPVYLVGNELEGEFTESFAGRAYDNAGWIVENNRNTVWQPSIGNSYSPVVDPQDADGGCLVFFSTASEEVHIYSPLLNLQSLTNPKLKFWMYIQPSSYYATSIRPGFITGEGEAALCEPISIRDGATEGWHEFSFDVPEEVAGAATQLTFLGYGGSYGKVFIDNISIRSYLDHNLGVEASAPGRSIEIGEEKEFLATVINKGVNTESNYRVVLLEDDEEIGSAEGVSIAPDAEVTIPVMYKAHPRHAGNNVEFTVKVEMEEDLDLSDNSVTVSLLVNENDFPRVQNLTAVSDKNSITLNWEAPEISDEPICAEVSESFEGWDSWSTEASSGWEFLDVDKLNHSGFNGNNDNGVYTAMVAENFTGKYSWDLSMEVADGTKCLAITKAQTYNTPIEHWIFLPTVKGGSELTFMARTFYAYSATNTFDVMWAMEGTDTEYYNVLGTKILAAGDWTECSYTLPKSATRVAIRVKGVVGGDALLFDDFHFTSYSAPLELSGFNVYRNHTLVAELSTADTMHLDMEAEQEKTHTYHVTAQYYDGESMYSVPVEAKIGTTVGVDTPTVENPTETLYFNLQGIRVSSPKQGEPIIERRGNETRKIMRR